MDEILKVLFAPIFVTAAIAGGDIGAGSVTQCEKVFKTDIVPGLSEREKKEMIYARKICQRNPEYQKFRLKKICDEIEGEFVEFHDEPVCKTRFGFLTIEML
ncbi:hypothetical protein [Thermodesulfatator atlanticus]